MKNLIGIWLSFLAFSHAGTLDFKELEKVISAPVDVTTVTADYEFTNKTKQTVNIVKSDPGCSCVSVQIGGGKLRYEPGESGLIRAKFDMANFSGSVEKAIALWLDNDPMDKPSMTLKLTVHIPVLVAIEPKTLKWDLDGKPDPQVIHIKMKEGQLIRVTGVQPSSEAFTTKLTTIEEGKEYELLVTPTDLTTQGIGVFRIDTDCPVQKQRTQQAFAVVKKPAPAENAAKP